MDRNHLQVPCFLSRTAAATTVVVVVCCLTMLVTLTTSVDPQAVLGKGCSNYNVTSLSVFNENLNATFDDIKAKIGNGSRFVTTSQLSGSDPVYAMLQCRDYMSNADCLSCFASASAVVRNCSDANGGRVIYDGCFLRYERNMFYGETTTDANGGSCGGKNTSASTAAAFEAATSGLLSDLQMATPNTKAFFGASTRNVTGGVGNASAVYGIAQCVHTIDKAGCAACLKVAYGNIQRCPPQAGGRAIDSGCFMRYSQSAFFSANYSMDLAPFLKTGSSSKAGLIGGIAGGGAAVILIIIALIIWFRISRQKAAPRANLLDATELRGPVNYKYNDLKSATGNFKEENKLGQGGFGDVYKGTLKNGKIVAVKRLALAKSNRAQTDFVSEVTLISNVHHRNLVRLLGCCGKGPELLLVYEFMANKSLDRFLFGEKHGSLSWNQRFEIILGTAQGLTYLHEQFHVTIIHRDIKPGNILLDHDFQPKIADFGLVRLLPENQSHVSTRFAGTLGYTAPEYAIHGQLSEKVDTYSYGMVVLEIVSGKRSSEMMNDPGAEYLLKRAWRLYESGMSLELVDKSLDPSEYDIDEVKKVIEIALTCTQSSPSLRPTMSEVVVMLKHKGFQEPRQLTKPPFIDAEPPPKPKVTPDMSTSSVSTSSNATASIAEVSGR